MKIIGIELDPKFNTLDEILEGIKKILELSRNVEIRKKNLKITDDEYVVNLINKKIKEEEKEVIYLCEKLRNSNREKVIKMLRKIYNANIVYVKDEIIKDLYFEFL